VSYRWHYYKPDPQGRVFHADAEWEIRDGRKQYETKAEATTAAKRIFNKDQMKFVTISKERRRRK
jgi:hypothetical protein